MNLNYKAFIAGLAIMAISTGSFAQVKKKPAPAKTTPATTKPAPAAAPKGGGYLPIDGDVIAGKLPNGLTFYIRKNTEPKNRATLYLVNKVGSVLENDDQKGLA